MLVISDNPIYKEWIFMQKVQLSFPISNHVHQSLGKMKVKFGDAPF